jgi:hypothetical protein
MTGVSASTDPRVNAHVGGWLTKDLAILVASYTHILDCAPKDSLDQLALRATIRVRDELCTRILHVVKTLAHLQSSDDDKTLVGRVLTEQLEGIHQLPDGHDVGDALEGEAWWKEVDITTRGNIKSEISRLVEVIYMETIPSIIASARCEAVARNNRNSERAVEPSLVVLETMKGLIQRPSGPKTKDVFSYLNRAMAAQPRRHALNTIVNLTLQTEKAVANRESVIVQLNQVFHRCPGRQVLAADEATFGLKVLELVLKHYREQYGLIFLTYQNRYLAEPTQADLRFFSPDQADCEDIVENQGAPHQLPRNTIKDPPVIKEYLSKNGDWKRVMALVRGGSEYLLGTVPFYLNPADKMVTFRPIKYRIDFLTQPIVETIFNAGLRLSPLDLNGALYVALMDCEGNTSDYLERLIREGADVRSLVPATGEPILFDVVERLLIGVVDGFWIRPSLELAYQFLVTKGIDVNRAVKGKTVLGTLKERLPPNQIQAEGFAKFLAPFLEGKIYLSHELLIDMFEMCAHLKVSNQTVMEIFHKYPHLKAGIAKKNPLVGNASAEPFYAFMTEAGIKYSVSENPVVVFLSYVRQEFAKETVREKKQARLAPFFTLLQSLPTFPYNQEALLAEAKRVIEANPTIYGTIREDFFPNPTKTTTGAATTAAAAQ